MGHVRLTIFCVLLPAVVACGNRAQEGSAHSALTQQDAQVPLVPEVRPDALVPSGVSVGTSMVITAPPVTPEVSAAATQEVTASSLVQQLASQSTSVAHIRITKATSRETQTMPPIVTDIELSVLEHVQGTAAPASVTVAGGQVGDLRLHVGGSPTVTNGETYLAFLQGGTTGRGTGNKTGPRTGTRGGGARWGVVGFLKTSPSATLTIAGETLSISTVRTILSQGAAK